MADRVVRYVFQGQIADLQAKMKAASASVHKLHDDMTGADKSAVKFRAGLSTLGDTAGKAGLVAAAGLGAVVLATANFDKAMSKVQAATHETAANMDALREAAVKAGADTAFSASEAAAGIESLAKAGVGTADILGGGLQGALDLAAAGEMDVAEAAEAAAGAMAQFKLEGKDVPHIADLMAAGAGKAQGNVSDMVMAFKQAGTVASQTGLTLEETTGALAAMAEQSLLGSDAGTSFKQMLAALTPNSEKAASAMEQYNVHAFDAQGNFVGMSALAGQLRDGLGRLNDEQRMATLETIFGSDAVRAASIVYDNGADGIQNWTEQVNDAGYAAETAGIKLDNLAGDWERLTGSIETALIGQGEGSQGAVRSLVQGADDLVNVFIKLPAPLKDTATGMLAITAVLGGGAWFTSKAVAGVASMRAMMVQLGIASQTTALSMGAVASGAAVFAGLTFTGVGTLDMMNSAKRSREAADAVAVSFTELQTALTKSNVGKYAADLGIDLDRLATDLAMYGEKGEYVTEVQKMLEDSGHGVGAMFKALPGTIIPGYTNATEKASNALSDFNDILANNKRASEAGAGAGQTILAPLRALGGLLTATGPAADVAAAGIDGVAGTADDATRAVLSLDDAMSALFDGLDVDAATDSWRSSIRGLAKDLKGGDGALDRDTKKGVGNREDIRGQLENLRAMAEAQYDVDGNTKRLTETLLRGREAIIRQAVAAGISRDAMEKYLRTLGMTPREIRTTIKLMDAPKAADDLDGLIYKARILKDELRAMSHSRINIRARGAGGLDGYASGGYTGDISASSVAGVVHGKEFVVNARATAQNRALLEAINNGLPGYARGGYVEQRVQRSSSVTNNYGAGIDYDRLANAMSRARPLYGDVHVQGDGSFRREMQKDSRARAGGGVPF